MGFGNSAVEEANKPTATEIESASQAADMWQNFKKTFLPLEEAHASQVLDSNFQRESGVGRAVGLQSRDQRIVDSQLGLQTRSGAAPGSGRFQATQSRGESALGVGRGRAAIAANEARDARDFANRVSLVQLGRGNQNLGIATLSQQGGLDVAEKNAAAAASAQQASAIHQGVGLAGGLALSNSRFGDPVPTDATLNKGSASKATP